ncbi:iron-sulfur protein [Acetobacterium fimetarium]|uniref:Ferredoxin n=1 Tax=Acetobacterium fimetarium TaxID=52691 RepID=A0ABR6WS43_9FIRM|nr:EFR1 family ferrodoxin [Acetobacterium fimetarium]MBC3803333.1 iron-sulfur protein [Acetobacterium fimetarium]
MRSKIYYFSGTGNSLAVSRKLAESLTAKGSVVSMVQYENYETIDVDTEVLGFVFPVYFMTIPAVVVSFIEKLNFIKDPYIFAVATCNGTPGHCLFTLSKCLQKKGKTLSLGVALDMPGNAIVTPPEMEAARLNKSEQIVAEIARQINAQHRNYFDGSDGWSSHLQSLLFSQLGKNILFRKKSFAATHECVGCGICKRVCPVNNIAINDGRPVWQDHCVRCLACFHWCPVKAVSVGKVFSQRHQYHHPEISVGDMDRG